MHLRWILFNLGKSDSPLYFLNGIGLAIVFFGCRIVFGYWLTYTIITGTIDLYDTGMLPLPVPGAVSIL